MKTVRYDDAADEELIDEVVVVSTRSRAGVATGKARELRLEHPHARPLHARHEHIDLIGRRQLAANLMPHDKSRGPLISRSLCRSPIFGRSISPVPSRVSAASRALTSWLARFRGRGTTAFSSSARGGPVLLSSREATPSPGGIAPRAARAVPCRACGSSRPTCAED